MEKIPVNAEDYTKHINMLCTQNPYIYMLKQVVHTVTTEH